MPRSYAAGDFEKPYIVMEFLSPDASVRALLDNGAAAARGGRWRRREDRLSALHDLHRQLRHSSRPQAEQRDSARGRCGEAVLIDFGLSRHDQGCPTWSPRNSTHPGRHRPLRGARAGAARARRSEERHLRARRHAVFSRDRRTAVRRAAARRRVAPPAVARPGSAARRLNAKGAAVAAGDHPALPRGRPGRALCATAAQLAFDLQHPDQVPPHRARRAARARRAGCGSAAPAARPEAGCRGAAARSRAFLANAPIIMVALDLAPEAESLREGLAVAVQRVLAAVPGARLACLNVLKTSRAAFAIDPEVDAQGRNLQFSQRLVRAAPLGARAAGRGRADHLSRARGGRSGRGADRVRARNSRVDHIVMGARGAFCRCAPPARQRLGQGGGRGSVHRDGGA